MGYSVLRRLAVLLVFAQLLVAWAPICAFACAGQLETLAVTQDAAAPEQVDHACACGMQALCQVAFAPALSVGAPLVGATPPSAAPDSVAAFLLTRYISPLPEPPVA